MIVENRELSVKCKKKNKNGGNEGKKALFNENEKENNEKMKKTGKNCQNTVMLQPIPGMF